MARIPIVDDDDLLSRMLAQRLAAGGQAAPAMPVVLIAPSRENQSEPCP